VVDGPEEAADPLRIQRDRCVRIRAAITGSSMCAVSAQADRLTKLGGDAPESTTMFATFSPDSSRVAYVRANNIYVEELSSGKISQLTSDGSADIINGRRTG